MKVWVYLLCSALLLGRGMGGLSNQCEMGQNPGNDRFILDENSWELMLQGEWLIGFCVPLLMTCIKFERIWSKFGHEMQLEQSPITVASMKLEYSETVIKRFSLIDLPTMLHVKDGVFRKLPVAHSLQELKQLAQGDWQKSEPIPFWQHPNGVIIRIYVFYIRAIDSVYQIGWLDIDYEKATWLVRIGVTLVFTMTVTIICGIYTYVRDSRVIKQDKIAEENQ